MLTHAVLLGILDRAIKNGITAAALYLTGAGPVNLFTLDWRALLGAVGGAVLLSVLMSLGSLPLGDPGTTSALRGAR